MSIDTCLESFTNYLNLMNNDILNIKDKLVYYFLEKCVSVKGFNYCFLYICPLKRLFGDMRPTHKGPFENFNIISDVGLLPTSEIISNYIRR